MLRACLRVSFFGALLFAPDALGASPYVHLELGATFEHASYRRIDLPNHIFGVPPWPTPYIDRTAHATGVGAPLRFDLGALLGDVAIALSAQLAYVSLSADSGFGPAGIDGSLSWAAGLSSIWFPRSLPAASVRLGCLYETLGFTGGGNEIGTPDNTFDVETMHGVDCHVGAGWDLLQKKAFRLGPALRFDGARLSNGRSNGSSTYTTAALSLTLAATFL